MIPSFLKKQRKHRDRHSPPTSPASFFSPNLERSPDTSPPPLPTFPTSTSNPTSFPHPTRLAWPPPQSLSSSISSQQKPQALPISPPHPPTLSITTVPNTTAVNGLGSPEIQLDLGFTSESLLDGFTGFFDRSRSVTSSVRTGSPAPSMHPPGVQHRPAEPPNTSKPTPPTPTLTPATATGTSMPMPPSGPGITSGTNSGIGAGTGAGTNTNAGTSGTGDPASSAGSRAASRSRSDALAPLKIPGPSSKGLPSLNPPSSTPSLSLFPLSIPFTAPSPTSPHAPSPSSSSAGRSGASQYSYASGFSRTDDPNAVYTDTDTDAYSDSEWSYASAPDLDWGLSPGVSFASIPFDMRGRDSGAGGSGGKVERPRRTSTGSVAAAAAWRARNSHRLTRQDSATLPFDPVQEAFYASLERGATSAGGKRSRHNSVKRVSRRASEYRQSRRGSRHSRKSRPQSAGVSVSLGVNGGGSGPVSASASRPGSAAGAGPGFGTFGSLAPGMGLSPGPGSSASGVNGGTGRVLTPVEPMPEDAAAVVRASGGGAGAHRRRSTKRKSPKVHGAVVGAGKSPPLPAGMKGTSGAGVSPVMKPNAKGDGASESVDVVRIQESPKPPRPTHAQQSPPDAIAEADIEDADADPELTLEDVLTGTNGYAGMNSDGYRGMGLGMGKFRREDMGSEMDTVMRMSNALGASGGLGLDGILGRLQKTHEGKGEEDGTATEAGSATATAPGEGSSREMEKQNSGAGAPAPNANGINKVAPSHSSPVVPHTAPISTTIPYAASPSIHPIPSKSTLTPPRLPPVRGLQEPLGRSRSAQATVGPRKDDLGPEARSIKPGGLGHGHGLVNTDIHGMNENVREGEGESSLGLSGIGKHFATLGRNASASASIGTGSTDAVGADGGGAGNGIRPLPPNPPKVPHTNTPSPRQRTAAPARPLPQNPSAGVSVNGGDTGSRPRSPLPTPAYSSPASVTRSVQASGYHSPSPSQPVPPPASSQDSQRRPTAPTPPTHPVPLTSQRRSFSAPQASSTPSSDLSSLPSCLPDSTTSPPMPAVGMGNGMGMRSASPAGGKFMHPPRPAETYSAWKNKSTGDVSQTQTQTPSTSSTLTHTQTAIPKADVVVGQNQGNAPTTPGSGFSVSSNHSVPIAAGTAEASGGHGPSVRRMSVNQVSGSRGTSPAPSYQLSETSSTTSLTSLGRGPLPIGNGNVSKLPTTAVERLQHRAGSDKDIRRVNTAPLVNSGSAEQRAYPPPLLHRELSTTSTAAFPETPHEFSPILSPGSSPMPTSMSPAPMIPVPSRRMMPKAPMIDPAPPPKRRSRPPLPIGPRKPSVRMGGASGAGLASANLGPVTPGVVHGASSSSSSSISLVTTNTSVSGAAAAVPVTAPAPVPAATRGSGTNSNSSGDAVTKSTYTPPSPKFQTRPVRWRGLTMDAAKWTLTSGQLQDIVGRAIRQSAEASSIRLLTLDVLDKEIPEEIRRLELVRDEIKSKYRGTVRRRRVLFRSVTPFADGSDSQTRARLAQELMDVSITCDTLSEELFRVMDDLQQLHRLSDVHSASALAMALRKLNSSFLKQSSDAQEMARHVVQIEAERDEAWATAERVEHDLLELQAKMDVLSNNNGTLTPSTASNRSSRVSAARKTSIRASKASLRLSRGARSSQSSTSSQRLSAFAPPVPPVPRLPYTSPHVQALPLTLSLNTDIPTSSFVGSPYSHSRALSSANMTGISPTPEALALAEAQNELYDMLGISRADLRRTRSGRSNGHNFGRPTSELSPSSMPGSPFPSHATSPLVRSLSDMLVPSGAVGRRRNASLSIPSRPVESVYIEV